MRNGALHQALREFTTDAARRLSDETAAGCEVPFELVEEPGGRVPLYCYRPLTSAFIRDRISILAGLDSYAPAIRALSGLEGLAAYLLERGEHRPPSEPRPLAEAGLRAFLGAVFGGRSEFGFDPGRFETAYAALELVLYEGRCTTTVLAPLHGVALDPATTELALGDGLSLIAGDAYPDAPGEAVWGAGPEPSVLAVFTVAQDRAQRAPVSLARTRFRRVLTALRLFDRGGYAFGPIGWMRTETGPWRVVPLGVSGRPRLVTSIPAAQEDELRAFCNLVSRRAPKGGELGWALSRFEMGCERLAPFEALSDYLLALRALLEPEGPESGRLPQRLAVICAPEEGRAALAERAAEAAELERAVITGIAPGRAGADQLVAELADHLRAIIRDALCGHLDADLCGLADELLAEAGNALPAPPVPVPASGVPSAGAPA